MNRTAALIAAAALVGLAAPAWSAEPFQMLGTWKGDGIVVFSGRHALREAESDDPSFPGNTIEFTYVIDKQVDNRFSGTSTAAAAARRWSARSAPQPVGHHARR